VFSEIAINKKLEGTKSRFDMVKNNLKMWWRERGKGKSTYPLMARRRRREATTKEKRPDKAIQVKRGERQRF